MEGYEIELTKEHNLMTENGEWIQIGKILPETKIRLHNHPRDQVGNWESCEGTYDEGYLEGRLSRSKHSIRMRVEKNEISGYDVEYRKSIDYCLGFVHGFILYQCRIGTGSHIECVSPFDRLLPLLQRILLRLNIVSVVVDRSFILSSHLFKTIHFILSIIQDHLTYLIQIKTCYDRMSCSIFCVNY